MTAYWNEEAKLWWPEGERPRVYGWMMNHLDSVRCAVKYVRQPVRCVQAGGYIGVWPIELAKYFEWVHTFEPIPESFECLERNVRRFYNIFAQQCALGSVPGTAVFAQKYSSSTMVFDRNLSHSPVTVKVRTIDELKFSRVDALFLDVERSELAVLVGGEATIQRDHPVITLECLTGQVEIHNRFMENIGYRRAEITHNDHIFIWGAK